MPATIAEMRYSKLAFRMRNWRSPESRRLMYLEYVLANDEHAKEVKLFGLGPLLLDRYKDARREVLPARTAQLAREARARGRTRCRSSGTGAFYGAYASMALLAAAGTLTLGNMTLYVMAFRQGQQAFQSVLGGIGGMYEHNLYMCEPLRVPGHRLAAPPGARDPDGQTRLAGTGTIRAPARARASRCRTWASATRARTRGRCGT